MSNVGGGIELYRAGTSAPFEIRTLQSSDASISIVQNANDVDITTSATEDSASNVGGNVEIYRNGTQNPFEFRTLQSSDTSINIVQNANDVDVTTSATEDSASNVGGNVEIYRNGTQNPFEFRTLRSSDASINIVQNANDVDLTAGGGAAFTFKSFTLTATLLFSNNTTVYQTAWTSAASGMTAGENWLVWVNVFQDQPISLTSVHTQLAWYVETAPAVFSLLEGDINVNNNLNISVGTGTPEGRFYRLLPVAFTGARFRLQMRMDTFVAAGGIVENPRVFGIRVP